MRVLVNGLSLGSLSGRHVLYGHLRQLAQWTAGRHEWVVLHAPEEQPPADLVRENVSWTPAPKLSNHWATRSLWEAWEAPRLMRRQGINAYFTPNGVVLPRAPVPMTSLAQNPWPLVRSVQRTALDRLKGRMQRAAFRAAFQRADLMAYNSQHMRDLYTANAPGVREGGWVIAHQGINDATHDAGEQARRQAIREPGTIVSVSAMAHWKGAETLVDALAELKRRGVPARVRFVGPWPDPAYQARIREQIQGRQLEEHVAIAGQVSLEQLHAEYARAEVFCLMSCCESFGIPAIEAQAFGTPVVGTNVCAMAEIGGAGGVFGPAGDAAWTADRLEELLTDRPRWERLSAAAVQNSRRFRWSECSRPLLRIVDEDGRSAPHSGESTALAARSAAAAR